MLSKNWTEIEESTPFETLPPGGYVVRITNVENVPSREYMWVVYDIAEGDYKGFYDDNFGQQNEWAHRFTRSYKLTAEGMFKNFLARLEDSNPKFSIANWQTRSDENEFIGLILGVVLQTRYYTNLQGEDKEALEVRSLHSAQDIRTGKYKLPDPHDDREKIKEPIIDDGDLPF